MPVVGPIRKQPLFYFEWVWGITVELAIKHKHDFTKKVYRDYLFYHAFITLDCAQMDRLLVVSSGKGPTHKYLNLSKNSLRSNALKCL